MPKKIPFNVIYCTGEDERFRACELDEHGPAVRGWQSPKDCLYPQELVIRLQAPAVLHQIQILAHQYLIPERVELWLCPEVQSGGHAHGQAEYSDDPRESQESEYSSLTSCSGSAEIVMGLQFDYLGYITLSDNSGTDFRSRELKSVTVPQAGAPSRTSYVKLSLHSNHHNLHNPQNQVSLVAIQLLGEDATGDSTGSAFDDLAFEMYVDKDVARIIRSMEKRKEEAVRGERFTYAGKLKAAMLALREIGEKLGRLEVGKWQAISSEDYVRANRKKEQMESLRRDTYLALGVDDLLEENGPMPKNDEGQSDVTDSNTTLSEENPLPVPLVSCPKSPVLESGTGTAAGVGPGSNHHPEVSAGHQGPPLLYHTPVSPLHYTNGSGLCVGEPGTSGLEARKPSGTPGGQAVLATPVNRTGSLKRREKSATRNSYEAYDERVLPAHRNVQCLDTGSNPATGTGPHATLMLKMNEKEKKQAALPIAVFGPTLVEKFYSRQYPDKEEGLRVLEALLRSGSSTEGPNKTARAAVFLLHRALRDKVFSVYSLASSVVTYFFSHYITGKVSTAEITRSVDKILPELLSKSGDSTPRVHNTAVHTVLSMAHATELRKLNIIPVHLTRTLTSSTHPRLALSRLEMVEQLILSLGISNDKQSGMTCRVLSELGASGLHHPAESVRKVAERVLVQVYKVNPRLVRKQLPPDDDITRRNLLYRHLMTEFDKIDLERKQDVSERGKLVRSGSVSSSQPSARSGSQSSGGLRSSISSYAANTAHQVASQVVSSQAHHNSHLSHQERLGASERSPNDSPRHPSSPVGSSGHHVMQQEKQCIFCLRVSEGFTEEGLNIHYWKYCPMLTRCIHCQEVVEVGGLSSHLVQDCDLRRVYTRCDSCSEAVETDCQDRHLNECTGSSCCPFCKAPVDNEEAGWREHLIGEDGRGTCPKHPRAKYYQQPRSSSPREYDLCSSIY